jgi:hypothetical protein
VPGLFTATVLLGRRWDAEYVGVSVDHHVSAFELGCYFRSGDFVLAGQLCCIPVGAEGLEDSSSETQEQSGSIQQKGLAFG